MSLTRHDIHKGALGLEQIAACFHELAGAADMIVTAQRKLSRALKEGASSKGCPEIAKNAFNASAWIIDILSQVDTNYACTIEREYEVLSADLRKWFKKLAKDERDHDDFIAARETRIRQAGEVYERRALKKDIAGEHTRYVELLNTLGAEIASAQQQHIDEVNTRHATITIASGACLARVADASWARTCGAIRRCAAGIGSLGEARAWCESGWQGSRPTAAASAEVRQGPGSSRPFPESSFRSPSRRPGPSSVVPSVATPLLAHPLTRPNTEPPPSRLADGSHSNRSVLSSGQSELYSDYYTTAPDSELGIGDQSESQLCPKDDGMGAYPASPDGMASGRENHRVVMSDLKENHTTQSPSPTRHMAGRETISSSRQSPSPLYSGQDKAHMMAARTRPATPNSPSSRWAAKGLRRFSMPSFTSAR